jgi:glucose/mannose-6-phosphate isomerase
MKLPVFVNRNYTLPEFVSSKTLLVASSYSGNTEETLSAYREAKRKKAKIVALTSGGTLQTLAKKDGIPCVTIPSGLPPRCALGYAFFLPLVLLQRLGIGKNQSREIKETVRLIRNLRDKKLGKGIVTARNTAKRIARNVYGKFPVIYGAQDHIDSVVTRWRGQLGENSKTLSSSHVLPEMNHNEIVGWKNPHSLLMKCIVIILRDKGDHPRIKRRTDITKRIIEQSGVKTIELYSIGKSLLARMFSLIYIGDYMSFYLAILNREDPTPVDRISYLKKLLAQ